MSEPIQLDEFLTSQSSDTSGFTATLEPIDDKPSAVRVTPYREDRGCGCASSFELPKEMIESVVPTSRYHYCCGKRLEVVVVNFTDNAAVPVAELMKPMDRSGGDHHAHGPGPGSGSASGFSLSRVAGTDTPPPRPPGGVGGQPSALVGRWNIPWTRCELVCIEVCTRFCNPWGWDCCAWETRCVVNCPGGSFPVWGGID